MLTLKVIDNVPSLHLIEVTKKRKSMNYTKTLQIITWE